MLLKENVEMSPNDANSHYKLGLVYEFKKNYEDALVSYKAAVSLKEDHAKALNALGRVFMKTGQIKDAKDALEAAKKADPALEEPTVLLSNIRDELSSEPKKHKQSKGKKSKKSKSSKKPKKSKTKTKKQ
jgi:tetratricopeptide (TPR) repeat protein